MGCGTGLDLPHLPDGATTVALDYVPANLRRTAGRASGREAPVSSVLGDAHRLPFAADAFDAVLAHLVLTVVPDPATVVAEIDRVLATDGRVSIFDKFVREGERPSLVRRLLDPLATRAFSSLTRRLEPMLAGTDLAITRREWLLGGFYSVAVARHPSG